MEQKLNVIFSLIAFYSSWFARYLIVQLIKTFVLKISTYPLQHIAICFSHRIHDFYSVPCNTDSAWIASGSIVTSPKNYLWKDHQNNSSISSISKPHCFARTQGQETNIPVHWKSGQKSTEGLKVSNCLSPARHNPKSHKSLYSDSIPSFLNSYNQAQAYLFYIPRYSILAHWQISDLISAFQMALSQITMLQSLQLLVFTVSHVNIFQQLIPSYSLWRIRNINRIAWSSSGKFLKSLEIWLTKNKKNQQTSLFPSVVQLIRIMIDIYFYKGKKKKHPISFMDHRLKNIT